MQKNPQGYHCPRADAGQKINVKELAKKYGSSETPVKQALNQLVFEQIIENYPRHGMKIKSIDGEEAREIFQLRLMMDLYYTKEIIEAVRINRELRDALERNVEEHFEILEKYEKDNSVENYMEYYLQDARFHELYHSINPFIYSNYIFRKQSIEKNYSGLEEHRSIIQAIFDEDEERLKTCLKAHIDNALQAIEIIIKTDKML